VSSPLLAGAIAADYIDGTGAGAAFYNAGYLAVDNAGTSSSRTRTSYRIRQYHDQRHVTTIAGSGTSGYLDGPALTAQFMGAKTTIAVDPQDNIWVADLNADASARSHPRAMSPRIAGSGVDPTKTAPVRGKLPDFLRTSRPTRRVMRNVARARIESARSTPDVSSRRSPA